MKFLLDTEECDRQGISVGTALLAAALYYGSFIGNEAFEDACTKGLLVYDGFDIMRNPVNPRITDKGTELVESLFLNSEFKPTTSEKVDRFEALASKLRELYPEGRKAGTSYMWRDSIPTITKKLKAFVKKFGDKYSDEDIIEATKRYINSFNGDYRFMQLLKYFILKRVIVEGEIEETSQLLSYLSNSNEDERQDWTSMLS